jgi:hypothetical protein
MFYDRVLLATRPLETLQPVFLRASTECRNMARAVSFVARIVVAVVVDNMFSAGERGSHVGCLG